MKNFICCSFAAILALVSFTGCKKDKNLDHTQVTEVSALFTPENNKSVLLDPLKTTIVFDWAKAKAEDSGIVLYEVVFDKENGDFSKPLYSLSADKNGLDNKLTTSYEVLNKVAELAGIKASGKGKIKWTVWSSKGINVKRSPVSYTLELARPEGFTEIPNQLFMTGDATETGADLSKALPLKQLEPGVFEIHTALKAGTYYFADKNSGTPRTFSLNTATSKLVEGGTNTVTGATKVYRIVVKFKASSLTATEIAAVGLWFAPDNKILFELPYKGAGQWEIKDQNIVFKQEGWGRDERYKFRLTVKDSGGAQTTEDFGSENQDNSRPDNNSPLSYWYLKLKPTSQWDNCFKFNGNADNKKVDILVDFSPAATAYTHVVTVK